MKQNWYIFFGILTIVVLFSCKKQYNYDYRDLEPEIKNAQADALIQTLSAPAAGWNLKVTTQNGPGTNFYFVYGKTGLLNSNSEFIKTPLETLYQIAPKTDSLILEMYGSHLKYVIPTPFYRFLITDFNANKITAINLKTKETVYFTPALAADLKALNESKGISLKLIDFMSANNNHKGVIRNASKNFVARYELDLENDSIKISYVSASDKLLHHVNQHFSYNGASIETSPITINSSVFKGIKFDTTTKVLTPNVTGTALSIASNKGVLDLFLQNNMEYVFGKNAEAGDASPVIWNNTGNPGFSEFDIWFTWPYKDLVAITNDPWGYLFARAVTPANAKPSNDGYDKVFFSNFEGWDNYAGWMPEWMISKVKSDFADLYKFYFSESGVYIIKENADAKGTGINFYILSANGQHWIKVKANTVPREDLTRLGTLSVAHDNSGGPDAGEGSKKLVDNNNDSKFLVFNINNHLPNDFWYQLTFTNPVVINYYEFVSGNDAPERDPKNWLLLGSQNGVTWTQLDAQTGVLFENRNQTKGWSVNNTTAYKIYRIKMTANNGSSLFQQSEWRVFKSLE